MSEEHSARDRGNVAVDVEFTDGRKEAVEVIKLRLKEMRGYHLAIVRGDRETTQIFTDRDLEWVDRLTDESQLELLRRGHELNLPLFERWFALHLKTQEALRPEMIKDLEQRAFTAALEVINQGGRS